MNNLIVAIPSSLETTLRMYKKVYITIDSSEFSKQALSVATKIAQTFNAHLCVAHCIDEDSPEKKEKGSNLLLQAKSTIENINVDTLLLVSGSDYGINSITMAIAASVTDWGADLVVAGTSNKKGIDRFFLGSVAEELIKKIDCSIMLVRMN